MLVFACYHRLLVVGYPLKILLPKLFKVYQWLGSVCGMRHLFARKVWTRWGELTQEQSNFSSFHIRSVA